MFGEKLFAFCRSKLQNFFFFGGGGGGGGVLFRAVVVCL